MKTAILYVRVSTDEQAERGYSQRSQEEVLRKYCTLKAIPVSKVYYEDHSAKTFNRPVWKKLLVDVRKSKRQTSLILFTKWDRFSRNAGDAYSMINLLRKFGAEPQAIEQPLDLAIPENKMMLAFYLAAPEVENDRRSLNVFYGQRRARKEGRWISAAPMGYANLSSPDGRKYIAPVEPAASAMKWALNELSTGKYSIDQVFRIAVGKGLTCKRNNFYTLIRNPVYCGKIVVPKFQDEEQYLADGLHEALITEATYYRILAVVDHKKIGAKAQAPRMVSMDMLPLRGMLICPNCNRMLTGSASRGRQHIYYHYYHCFKDCKWRYRAEEVNVVFEENIRCIMPRPEYVDLYKEVIAQAFKRNSTGDQDFRKQLLKEIQDLNSRMSHARELVLTGEFDAADFKKIKLEAESKINALEAEIPEATEAARNFENRLNVLVSKLKVLFPVYQGCFNADTIKKRSIIGSIYPQKLTFNGGEVRTTRINEIFGAIGLVNNELDRQKKWTTSGLMRLSTKVGVTGFEPVTLCL
jgi:site-specific DNA recombinase